MGAVNKPLENLNEASSRLRDALDPEPSDVVHDAAIQRFEFCFESCWKAVQQRLRADGSDCASPKRCFQEAWRQSWLQESAALSLIADRNLAVHTYDLELAEQVYSRLGDHHATITRLSSALRTD